MPFSGRGQWVMFSFLSVCLQPWASRPEIKQRKREGNLLHQVKLKYAAFHNTKIALLVKDNKWKGLFNSSSAGPAIGTPKSLHAIPAIKQRSTFSGIWNCLTNLNCLGHLRDFITFRAEMRWPTANAINLPVSVWALFGKFLVYSLSLFLFIFLIVKGKIKCQLSN